MRPLLGPRGSQLASVDSSASVASCPRNVAFQRQAPPQGLLHGIDATTSINMSPAAGTQLSRSAYYYYYYY